MMIHVMIVSQAAEEQNSQRHWELTVTISLLVLFFQENKISNYLIIFKEWLNEWWIRMIRGFYF